METTEHERIPFEDFRTASISRTDRWGHRFWLYPVDEPGGVYNVLNWEGRYLATVQRTQSGWKYYGQGENFASRKHRTSRWDAFTACVASAPIRAAYDR